MKTLYWLVSVTIFVLSCNQTSESSTRINTSARKDENLISCSPGKSLLGNSDSTTMSDMEVHGHANRPAAPNDLKIMVNGFRVIPIFGLNNWAAVTPYLDSAVVSGDVIIRETDFAFIQQEVVAHGLTIKDVHKYPARDGSVILFMHISGFGNNAGLSGSVRTLLARLGGGISKNDQNQSTKTTAANLDRIKLDSILGYEAEASGDIFKYTIRRPEALKAHSVPLNMIVEFNTWAAWQGTGDKAMIAGDFTLFEDEVGPVIKALAESGFELVHNQMVHQEPRIFLLHYWAVGKAENLAKGLKTALNHLE